MVDPSAALWHKLRAGTSKIDNHESTDVSSRCYSGFARAGLWRNERIRVGIIGQPLKFGVAKRPATSIPNEASRARSPHPAPSTQESHSHAAPNTPDRSPLPARESHRNDIPLAA